MTDVWAAAAAQEIEAEPVPASGLMIVRCQGCGEADTLAVPHMVPVAICETCRWAGVKPAGKPRPRTHPEMLACFPMRPLLHENHKHVVAHPAPEAVTPWLRDFSADQTLVPAPVTALAEMAREIGWKCEVRYARGNGVHGITGKPTSLRHSFAMRFGGHPLTACEARAVYVRPAAGAGAWTWGSVWLFGPDLPFFGWAGVTQLKEWLRAAGSVEPSWYADVRGLAELAEEMRKAREKAKKEEAPAKRKPRESGG